MSATTPSPGRPRDPDLDRRIGDAAIALFGDVGWDGFSMEGVARRAGAGKASLYLRWSTKDELLTQAVRDRVRVVPDVVGKDVRADLLHLAHHMMRNYLPDAGRSMLRLRLEAHRVPGLNEHWDSITTTEVLSARAVVRRGVERGDLPPDTSATLLLDTLCGAVMMHALTAPESLKETQAMDAEAFTIKLVDFVLSAVRSTF